MEHSNYDGPGIYLHYKGGHYRVLGIAQPEADGPLVVVYHSYSIYNEMARHAVGVDFVTRPLHSADGEDAFNDLVNVTGVHRPRFEKIYA